MATALQRQLAQISANSTHQLDLKAQRTQHAKSLLFEPRDAAQQSFDDIYNICVEGFEELCQLDSRLTSFSSNLFSESSKDVDRGQLTRKENEDLDEILERFLGLAQGRLLLRPAQKNDQRLFPALINILPSDRQLPESFKWLHPYIAGLSCPPRHAIVAAAVSNRSLFSALNNYVLRVGNARHASGILLTFWAGVTAQAVNGMLDSSRSGRDSVRRQREEEILLKILPILQEALSVSKREKLDEMFLGVCMIVTILATKASLSDSALDAMMEAVAGAWSQRTLNEGLACLAVVAEEKTVVSLPAFVTRAMISGHVLVPLEQQAEHQRVSKLSAGWIMGIVRSARKDDDSSNIHIVKTIAEKDLLQESDTVKVIESLMSEHQDSSNGNISSTITEILLSVLNSERNAGLLRNSELDLPGLQNSDEEPVAISTEDMELDYSQNRSNLSGAERIADFNNILDTLPALPSELYSFLEPHKSSTDFFLLYGRAFKSALESDELMESVLNLKSIHRSSFASDPTFLTFLARVWTSGNPEITPASKVKALVLAEREIDRLIARMRNKNLKGPAKEQAIDLQALLPYLLVALADDRHKVREASSQVCRRIKELYGLLSTKSIESERKVWGRQSIYGPETIQSVEQIQWLSASNAGKFVASALIAVLEDCILDSGHLVRFITNILNNSTNTNEKKQSDGLTKEVRQAVSNFLASHARATPVLRVKLNLFHILGKIGKEARTAREEILLPFVEEWTALSNDELVDWCEVEGVHLSDMDVAVLKLLEHRNDEQIKLLRKLCSNPRREELAERAFDRQRELFSTLKRVQAKIDVVGWLLELALTQETSNETIGDLALDTLRALQLPSEVAVHMIESLSFASDLGAHPPASKRQRRTSGNERPRALAYPKKMMIRRITLVLELVESSKQVSPALLRPLFHFLGELRQFKTSIGSELVYLHSMLLDLLHSLVTHLQTDPTLVDQIDVDIIRTDLLVDCVRSSSSPQIHNTALLVVSALASLAPESVLHSVIPLFTFMSSTVVRKTDDYSAHITDQAVSRIVPALSASLKNKGNNLLGGVSELLLSFVAAWEHVPLHRRLSLFETVVRSVGSEECLGVVAAMLVERYPNVHSSIAGFVVELVGRFEAVEILGAANQWLHLVSDALSTSSKPKQKGNSLSESLLAFADKNEEERVESVETMLESLTFLLRSETIQEQLVVQLAASGEETVTSIRSTYATITERVIQLTQSLGISSSRIRVAAEDLVSATLGLLPTPDFIASCAQLMQSGSASTREQVFHSLESRVNSTKSNNSALRQTFLDILPSCAVFVSMDQPIQVRMAAIGCIDAICDKFGKSDKESVKNAAEKVASDAALGATDIKLRSFSLLCLASIAAVLGDGDESISIFPQVLTLTLDYLAGNSTHEADGNGTVRNASDSKALQDSAFRLLTALLDHIPWILTSAPQELDRALTSAAKLEDDHGGAIGEFNALMTKKVSAPELFKSIERIWSKEIDQLNTAQVTREDSFSRIVRHLLQILHRAAQYHTKAIITMNSSILFSLLIKAFDLLRQSRSTNMDIVISGGENEFGSVDQLALDITLKMNDATFRPFFIRLVEWATSSLPAEDVEGRRSRMTSLFSFALLLFEKLKSLVTSYMSYLLDGTSEVLRDSFDQHADDELLQLVMKTLDSSFRSDEDDFWTAPVHFDVVSQPLLHLLANPKALADNEIDGVISTVTNLAAAVTASQDQLKSINSLLLSLLRHESADARLAAVQCQRSITKRVTFDWLALLPEILPAISELQEDDDDRVERQTLLWVKEIEEISGESLDGMLA